VREIVCVRVRERVCVNSTSVERKREKGEREENPEKWKMGK